MLNDHPSAPATTTPEATVTDPKCQHPAERVQSWNIGKGARKVRQGLCRICSAHVAYDPATDTFSAVAASIG